MRPEKDVLVELVKLLYTALPQVASVTTGTVVGAIMLYIHAPSIWSVVLVASSAAVMAARIGPLLMFKRQHSRLLTFDQALQWERVYGAASVAMALVIAAMTLGAFAIEDPGMQLLATGLVLATCAGQSSTRIACRPWIPISTGLIVLTSLIVACVATPDWTYRTVGILLVLYAFTHVEACRHGARTIIGRLLAEREVARLAEFDAVSGLSNRSGYDAAMERAIAKTRRGQAPLSLLTLDLDGFKAVNDTLGHAAGDAVLAGVGQRLRSILRETDFAARIGGDEFAIIITDEHDKHGLQTLAERVIAALSAPFDTHEGIAQTGVSVGIALASGAEPLAKALAAAADGALYASKRAGKGRYAFADPIAGRVTSFRPDMAIARDEIRPRSGAHLD